MVALAQLLSVAWSEAQGKILPLEVLQIVMSLDIFTFEELLLAGPLLDVLECDAKVLTASCMSQIDSLLRLLATR